METAPPLPSIDARLHLVRPGFTLDVDLHLPGRGVTALYGPSGCGKTTCLRGIAGLTRNHPNPDLARARPGRVVVNGEVWQDDAAHLWRATHERALGYVFQEASLFDHLNVRGNITYGLQRTPPARRERDPRGAPAAVDALASVDVAGRLERGQVLGEDRVADAEAVADRGELDLRDGRQRGRELEARGCDEVRVQLGHQALMSSSPRPARAAAPRSARKSADSPRPRAAGRAR